MIKDRGVLFLASAQIIVWAGLYYSFPALLVRWEQDLGWSKLDITGAITLAIFLSAIFSPFSGRLIDSGNGPRVMTLSTLIASGSLFCLGFIDQILYFYIFWGIIGACFSGCLYDPCFALVTRGRGDKAKQSIILITLIAGFAGAISFPTAHTLSDTMGWRTTVMIFAGFVALVGAPLMWLGSSIMESGAKKKMAADSPSQKTEIKMYRTPVFLLLASGFALAALVHSVILQHLLPILHERKISADVAVMAASFIGPMQVAGRLAMMAAQKFSSNHNIALSCFIVMGLSILVLMMSNYAPPLIVIFVVLFGVGYGMVSIIRPVVARDILGENNFGVKFGALSMFYLIGAASAPFMGSLIWKIGGYQTVLPCLVVLSAVGLMLYMSAHRHAKALQS
jgi:MFS family permease